MRILFIFFVFCSSMSFSQNPTSTLWDDFVKSKILGKQPILSDYSFSGYHFSEKEIPDVSGWEYFDVTEYGAVPNDENYDDDGIQAAINAAVESSNPAVVFFPSGRFIVSSDNDLNKSIVVNGSSIVLKGNGTGENGTEIHMDQMRVQNGHWQFRIQPASSNTSTITQLTSPALRGDFSVTVSSTSNLEVGQSVYLNHKSEEFARSHFGDLELSPDWTRLFGSDGGMSLYECHIISEIDGNKVTFKNPIQANLPALSQPYAVRNLRTIEEVGIEDILFTSAWEDYPEEFVHHKDDIHDYAWSAIQFKYVKNGWIRNCEFRHWNEGIDVRESIGVTIENVLLSGKRGHASFLTRRSYGLLVKDCVDEANHHHGPGTGYQGVSTVYLRHQMSENQSIDSHSGQPYATLYDDLDGGDFHSNGGPYVSYPHHARHMTFWNFIHKSSSHQGYDFWSVNTRKPATYAEPIFVGFQPTNSVAMRGELANEFEGQEVFPKSLFEAQLDFRLNPEKYALSIRKETSKNEIFIHPNPFKNELEIKSTQSIDQIQLIDLEGKSVEFTITRSKPGLFLRPKNTLSSGIYMLSIYSEEIANQFRVIKK